MRHGDKGGRGNSFAVITGMEARESNATDHSRGKG
jgi:hypothetical protein